MAMHYLNGVEIKAGDLVFVEGEARVYKVARLISDAESVAQWGVESIGVFVCADPLTNHPREDFFFGVKTLEFDPLIKISEDQLGDYFSSPNPND